MTQKGLSGDLLMDCSSLDLTHLLCEQAQAHAQASALVAMGRSISYAELFGRAGAMAEGLLRNGMRHNDLVAMVLQREPESIILLLATLLAGGTSVPLDPGYPPARTTAMLEDAKPALLLATRAMRTRLQAGATTPCLDPSTLAEQQDWTQAAARPWPEMAERIYVLFTSGSSGRPKGVAMRSEALARLTAWHRAHPRLGKAARTLQFAPLSFDVSFQEILTTFATGGVLVLVAEAERRDPYALLALLECERIERLYMPYVALQALAEAVAAGAAPPPPTLRDVITAGEQLRVTPAIRAMFRALPGSVLHNHYGPTETHVVMAHELDGDPSVWPELPPIGKPLPYVRTQLVDEDFRTIADGREGELLLGGKCLAEGYIGRPDLTHERFIEHGGMRWYRSGDLARADDSGVLHYLGRLDAQIKLDGYRIEPAEIEATLCRHPKVAEAAVVATGDNRNRQLVAYVVLRDPQASDETVAAELRAHCQMELAPYLVPQSFVIAPLLPLTASGKIDRRTLVAQDLDAPLTWPESQPLSQQLQALWQKLLKLDALDPQANLFDLGARSLTVVRALTELRRHGFHTLTVAQIYEHPSVAKLAASLSNPDTAQPDKTDALSRGERQRAALVRFASRRRGTT